jgi:hypothetical protein
MRLALSTVYEGDVLGQDTLSIMDTLETLDPAKYHSPFTTYPDTEFGLALKQTAMLIKAEVGLEVSAIDLGGWDTHFAQGGSTGQMASLMAELAGGLAGVAVALLFQILLISVFTNYSSSIASQILIGAGRVRTVAIALISGSCLNLMVSLLLIRRYGLAGVAVATAFASIVIDLSVMPLLLQRILGLSAISFLRRACARPLAVGVLQVLLFTGIRLTGRPDHWLLLIWQGMLAGTGTLILLLAIGMTSVERERFLLRPLRRVWRPERTPAEAA